MLWCLGPFREGWDLRILEEEEKEDCCQTFTFEFEHRATHSFLVYAPKTCLFSLNNNTTKSFFLLLGRSQFTFMKKHPSPTFCLGIFFGETWIFNPLLCVWLVSLHLTVSDFFLLSSASIFGLVFQWPSRDPLCPHVPFEVFSWSCTRTPQRFLWLFKPKVFFPVQYCPIRPETHLKSKKKRHSIRLTLFFLKTMKVAILSYLIQSRTGFSTFRRFKKYKKKYKVKVWITLHIEDWTLKDFGFVTGGLSRVQCLHFKP